MIGTFVAVVVLLAGKSFEPLVRVEVRGAAAVSFDGAEVEGQRRVGSGQRRLEDEVGGGGLPSRTDGLFSVGIGASRRP